MASVTIEKVDLSSLSSTCRTTAVSDHTVGCGWEIRVTKLNWTPGKWETRLFFFTPTIYFIHFKKWTAPKALQVFWIHSISLASLAWQSGSFPAMCFERRYQESFLSLKLGLVVWNGSFERECNLSFFGAAHLWVFQRRDPMQVSYHTVLLTKYQARASPLLNFGMWVTYPG